MIFRRQGTSTTRIRSRVGSRQRPSIALLLLLAPALLAWAPAIRDTATGDRLNDTQAASLVADQPPRTIGPVVDVVDGATGRPLYGRSAADRHAIGSITKLMTAYLTVHRLKLNRVITVSAKAVSVGGSTMWLVQGDRLTVRSLLYGLLIPSGNDAAEELAETMAGNDSAFARLMNAQARRFHLRCSHYVTPHGLDAKNQYSCAADVATMSRIDLRIPLLARIVSTRHAVVPGLGPDHSFDLVNTNLLLNWYPGAIGVKTGTTDQAGFSVTAAARRAGHTAIAVVLGSSPYGRFSDAGALLDFAFRDYVWPQKADTMWSTQSLIGHSAPHVAPVPRWESGWIDVGGKGYLSAPFDPH